MLSVTIVLLDIYGQCERPMWHNVGVLWLIRTGIMLDKKPVEETIVTEFNRSDIHTRILDTVLCSRY